MILLAIFHKQWTYILSPISCIVAYMLLRHTFDEHPWLTFLLHSSLTSITATRLMYRLHHANQMHLPNLLLARIIKSAPTTRLLSPTPPFGANHNLIDRPLHPYYSSSLIRRQRQTTTSSCKAIQVGWRVQLPIYSTGTPASQHTIVCNAYTQPPLLFILSSTTMVSVLSRVSWWS
jgi:hypothetical protein